MMLFYLVLSNSAKSLVDTVGPTTLSEYVKIGLNVVDGILYE